MHVCLGRTERARPCPKSKSYTGPVTPTPPTINYSYDTCEITPCTGFAKGQLTKVSYSDNSQAHRYAHDVRGRVTTEQTTVGLTAPYTIKTAYDSMDRPTCLTYPDDESVKTTYDSQGLALMVQGINAADCNGPVATTYLADSDYNAAGSPTRYALGNGLSVNYEYQPNLRLRRVSMSAANLLDYTYTYDNKGNVKTQLNAAVTPNETATMTYDERDRLIQVDLTAPGMTTATYRYAYDKIGNMTQKTEGMSTYSPMVYDTAAGGYGPHAIISATNNMTGAHNFEYDLNGNMTLERQETSPCTSTAMTATGRCRHARQTLSRVARLWLVCSRPTSTTMKVTC